jgi:hypothetical protein
MTDNITGWKNPKDCWKNVNDYYLLICSFIIKLLNTNKIFSNIQYSFPMKKKCPENVIENVRNLSMWFRKYLENV